MPAGVVGIAWYTEGEWGRFRAAVSDPDRLEPTYAEWVAVAEKAMAEFRKAGLNPRRVLIRVEAFVAWCESEGRLPDSGARAAYVTEVMARGVE